MSEAETAAAPPRREEARKGAARIGMPTAAAAAGCIFLVAVALQSLQENARALLGVLGEERSVVPLAILGAVALAVAVALAIVLIKYLGRLLASVRMIGAVLLALALLVAVSRLFPEGEAAKGRAAQVAERSAGVFGENAGDKLAAVVALARLDDPGGSWGFRALAGFLALASLAGIFWRRPVGVREFGHLAAHFGLLLVLLAVAGSALFGYRQEDLKLYRGANPLPVPPGDKPAFTVKLLNLEETPRPAECRLLAAPVGASAERLELDGARPSKTRWRGLDLEVRELVQAVPEEYVDESSGRGSRSGIRLALSGRGAEQKLFVEAGAVATPQGWPYRLQLAYERQASAAEADAACSRERAAQPDHLVVLAADGQERDAALLGAGTRKVGKEVTLKEMGVRLKVKSWLAAARIDAAGQVQEAPLAKGFPPAVELTAVTGGAEGSEKPVGFWLLGDGQAADAAGELPPELNGFRFRYEVFPEVLDVVVMEGPAGTFRLVEFRWGQPLPARDLPVGAELALSGGGSLRLVEAVSRTMHAWRPRQAPAAGEPKEPACRLAVSRGGQQREMWLFEGRKPDPEAFGFTFFMRTGGRYVLRRAAVLELADKRGSLGKQTVEFNRPLKVRGYQIVLAGAEGEGSAGGPLTTLPRLVIVRDYAVWALYAGLLLLAVGAPWLLWTRLRNVADTDGWEG